MTRWVLIVHTVGMLWGSNDYRLIEDSLEQCLSDQIFYAKKLGKESVCIEEKVPDLLPPKYLEKIHD